jgi:hypothetical protein
MSKERKGGGYFEAMEKKLILTNGINGFSDFVHRPGSKELEDKKHDVSETGSVSVVR